MKVANNMGEKQTYEKQVNQVEPVDVWKLTNSVDNRLLAVIVIRTVTILWSICLQSVSYMLVICSVIGDDQLLMIF